MLLLLDGGEGVREAPVVTSAVSFLMSGATSVGQAASIAVVVVSKEKDVFSSFSSSSSSSSPPRPPPLSQCRYSLAPCRRAGSVRRRHVGTYARWLLLQWLQYQRRGCLPLFLLLLLLLLLLAPAYRLFMCTYRSAPKG